MLTESGALPSRLLLYFAWILNQLTHERGASSYPAYFLISQSQRNFISNLKIITLPFIKSYNSEIYSAEKKLQLFKYHQPRLT